MGSLWAAWTSDMWELQNEGYFVLEDTDIWEASIVIEGDLNEKDLITLRRIKGEPESLLNEENQ